MNGNEFIGVPKFIINLGIAYNIGEKEYIDSCQADVDAQLLDWARFASASELAATSRYAKNYIDEPYCSRVTDTIQANL